MSFSSARVAVGLVCLRAVGSLVSCSALQKSEDGAILLQIYFKVAEDRAAEFEKMYAETYAPALQVQKGYIRSTLLRVYPEEVLTALQASLTEYNYQMELVFDTEENRVKWVASDEHQDAWPIAQGMAEKVAYRGYDLLTADAN